MFSSKKGFCITLDNVDYLIGGAKTIKEDADKSRILKNLYFEGNNISEQTKKKLQKVWW